MTSRICMCSLLWFLGFVRMCWLALALLTQALLVIKPEHRGAQHTLRSVYLLLWAGLAALAAFEAALARCKQDAKVDQCQPISAGTAHCGFKMQIPSATAQSIAQAKQWMLGFPGEILVSRASIQRLREMRETPENQSQFRNIWDRIKRRH